MKEWMGGGGAVVRGKAEVKICPGSRRADAGRSVNLHLPRTAERWSPGGARRGESRGEARSGGEARRVDSRGQHC